VQPACKRGGSGGIGAVDAHVGPFVEQGAVEPFDFAVPLGTSGWEASVSGAGGFDGRGERCGLVAGAVVGLEHFDGDAELGEPVMGSVPEADRGDGSLVGQDFAVGDPAVVSTTLWTNA
jgi:hypothetical protein